MFDLRNTHASPPGKHSLSEPALPILLQDRALLSVRPPPATAGYFCIVRVSPAQTFANLAGVLKMGCPNTYGKLDIAFHYVSGTTENTHITSIAGNYCI